MLRTRRGDRRKERAGEQNQCCVVDRDVGVYETDSRNWIRCAGRRRAYGSGVSVLHEECAAVVVQVHECACDQQFTSRGARSLTEKRWIKHALHVQNYRSSRRTEPVKIDDAGISSMSVVIGLKTQISGLAILICVLGGQ